MAEEILGKLGSYTLLRSLGKGGMGEVFLAFDERCDREIALKKIRSDLKSNASIKTRFLREARIAAKLSHPSIIPIHSIEGDKNAPYYTMPYIEGETLRQILHKSRLEEKKGKILHPIGGSIPMLLRIFLNACQAVAYSHSRGILHRDLKPDNILVGKFGETMIVDWGLAEYIEEASAEDFDESPQEPDTGLTRPGKVVGTLAYIAPERAMHEPASVQSDLYSLGVILYQILSLRTPFQRRDIKTFRRLMRHEKVLSPLEASPYRDIPTELSSIACQCLAFEKAARFPDVLSLIQKIERYLEGVPQWMASKTLDIGAKEDWEFQEHILLAKHQALSEIPEAMEWVLMMVSKSSFWGNVEIEAAFTLEEESLGPEILFGVPESKMRTRLIEGWSVKIGSSTNPGCVLLRDQIEAAIRPDLFLELGKPYTLRIEMAQETLRVYLDKEKLFEYTTPLPMSGNHVGLLLRDEGCKIQSLSVFVGSHNALVNCLAIPDAFLAKQQTEDALEEYRRIAYGFKGRTEGWQALFRAGSTLIALAKKQRSKKAPTKTRFRLFEEALEQFDTLSTTPAAPLEYLGKSLVYQALGDEEEEAKCLELSLRKAHLHPLRSTIASHVLFRLHKAAYESRTATYAIALLALRLLPDFLEAPMHAELLSSLSKHLELLPFLAHPDLATQLSFWLAKTQILEETAKENHQAALALSALTRSTTALWKKSPVDKGGQWLMLRAAIDAALLDPTLAELDKIPISSPEFSLARGQFSEAKKFFSTCRKEDLENERHPLFVPYGCYLRHEKGEEAAMRHFSDLSTSPYPPLTALLAHRLHGKSEAKIAPFLWQRMELLRQEALYARCSGEDKKAASLIKKLKKLR